MHVAGLLKLRQYRNHFLGGADVAQAQPRGEYLGEGAEPQRAFRRKGAHGNGRFLVVPQFAVGIVFNDPKIEFARFFCKELAAFQRNREARRIAERGHHVGKAGAAAFFAHGGRIESFFVRGKRLIVRTHEVKGLQRSHVGRRFDENGAAFVHKRLSGKINRLLRARHDHHFVGRRRNAAAGFVFGDEAF